MPGTSHTKLLLAQSLQELMVTTPLEKISVNDIVEHAGVGRNTFYYHFEDKYDLVNWYFQTGATQFLTKRTAYGNWPAMMDGMEEYFRENKVFYTNALRYTGQNNLQEYIYEFSHDIFMQELFLLDEFHGMTKENMDVVASFLASAFIGMLTHWVERGMRVHMSDYCECLEVLFKGSAMQKMFFPNGEEAEACGC